MSAAWSVHVAPVEHPGPVNPAHPLASKGGMVALSNVLNATSVWKALTKPQRELLLSTAAGFPIRARRDVRERLFDRGLISHPSYVAGAPTLTEAGRLVVAWRLP